jgi:hypothetical protein
MKWRRVVGAESVEVPEANLEEPGSQNDWMDVALLAHHYQADLIKIGPQRNGHMNWSHLVTLPARENTVCCLLAAIVMAKGTLLVKIYGVAHGTNFGYDRWCFRPPQTWIGKSPHVQFSQK